MVRFRDSKTAANRRETQVWQFPKDDHGINAAMVVKDVTSSAWSLNATSPHCNSNGDLPHSTNYNIHVSIHKRYLIEFVDRISRARIIQRPTAVEHLWRLNDIVAQDFAYGMEKAGLRLQHGSDKYKRMHVRAHCCVVIILCISFRTSIPRQ